MSTVPAACAGNGAAACSGDWVLRSNAASNISGTGSAYCLRTPLKALPLPAWIQKARQPQQQRRWHGARWEEEEEGGEGGGARASTTHPSVSGCRLSGRRSVLDLLGAGDVIGVKWVIARRAQAAPPSCKSLQVSSTRANATPNALAHPATPSAQPTEGEWRSGPHRASPSRSGWVRPT